MKTKVDAKDLAQQMTVVVEIKHYRSWRIRLWIATRLISFAAWLAWLNIEFEQSEAIDE